MKISIIIPAFNEERLLRETLSHVNSARAAFTALGWESELIVCDNNSKDRTADIARSAGATVVFEPVNQIARARNRGADVATGDWLLFIDADSRPSQALFADTAHAINSRGCVAGGCIVRLEDGYPVANFFIGFWNLLSRRLRIMAGSFIFCEAAVFRKIGGFNNEMFAGEELDLSKRLQQIARETDREIVILHRHPLLTSARKVRLYSAPELIWFFLRAAFNQKGTLTNRASCHPWYDGRR